MTISSKSLTKLFNHLLIVRLTVSLICFNQVPYMYGLEDIYHLIYKSPYQGNLMATKCEKLLYMCDINFLEWKNAKYSKTKMWENIIKSNTDEIYFQHTNRNASIGIKV